MTTISLIAFAAAVIICTTGLVATAGHLLRPRSGRLLLWFGWFSAMYGVRMFFQPPLAGAIGVPSSAGLWIDRTITYSILVPALLFIQELYGAGWRGAIRWLTAATGVFAIGALLIDLAAGNPTLVPDPSLEVMALFFVIAVIGAYAGYRPPRFDEWRVLLAGVVTFMLFILNSHAVDARLVPWRVSAEPIGFLVQLSCFGYIALTRLFAQGRQLAAVAQEMRSAREIQASILPRHLPAIGRLAIATRYEPLAAVAGDFYDIVPLDGDAVAVLVADVSGHGVPAALIASMVKVAFTASLRDTHEPGALLQRMNTTLCGMFERAYVTAACAVVRAEAGVVRYALAGHPSPLLLPHDAGEAIQLDERGLFLGIMPSATYVTATAALEPGGRLILYSDGVTETPGRDDDLFGVERLSAFASAERHRTPTAFADALIASLRRFAGSHTLPHDDVTLVVLDRARS